MVYKCPACGCSCGDDKHDAVKDVTCHQSPLTTHTLRLEGSTLLQCSAPPPSATLVISTQRTGVDKRINELTEACVATDVIQGCTLDVIQSRLNMETLPEGFVCNRMSDKLLLYKLDISEGLIAVACGIILTSDLQVTCSSYNEVLLPEGNQITCISQLVNLGKRLSYWKPDHCLVKAEAEPDVSNCEENYSAAIEACDTKLETEESAVCTVIEDLITQPSLSRREVELIGITTKIGTSSVAIRHIENSSSTGKSTDGNSLKQEHFQEPLPSVNVKYNEACDFGNTRRSQRYSTNLLSRTVKTKVVKNRTKTKDIKNRTKTKVVKKKLIIQESKRMRSSDKPAPELLTSVQLTTNKCTQCEKTFKRADKLTRHMQHVHMNSRQHYCTLCERSFNDKLDLTQHVEHVHEGRKYKCDKCDYCFKHNRALKLHTSSVHLKEKPHKCPLCDLCFSRKYCLTVHIKGVHNQEKNYACDQCEYKCLMKGNLLVHRKAVHEGLRLFPCSDCEYISLSKGHLKRHVLAVHLNEKPHLCTVCGKSFFRQSYLNNHIDAVHKGIKPFACTECDSRFPKSGALQMHIKAVHVKEKSHVCSVCSRSFSQMVHLKRHVAAVHNGYKPFECQQCQKCFSRQSHLDHHMKALHQWYPDVIGSL